MDSPKLNLGSPTSPLLGGSKSPHNLPHKSPHKSPHKLHPSVLIDLNVDIKKATESIQHILEPLILDYQIKYRECKQILDNITKLSLTSEFKSELSSSQILKQLCKILKSYDLYKEESSNHVLDPVLQMDHSSPTHSVYGAISKKDNSHGNSITHDEISTTIEIAAGEAAAVASSDDCSTNIGNNNDSTPLLKLTTMEQVHNADAPTTPPPRRAKSSWASPSSSDGSEIVNHFDVDQQAERERKYNELCVNVSQIERNYECINKSNFEETLCQKRQPLTLTDQHFRLTINLYNKSGRDILVLNDSERDDLQCEYRKLRGKLVKFKETPQNKLKHTAYKKLWYFLEKMIIYHKKNIKLYPCKKDLLSQRCNGTYCSFHHQDEMKIYTLLIPDHRYVLTFDNQFEEIKSSDNFTLFEDFIIKIHNYLYYNEVCRFKNNCRSADCEKIHNIHEQLYIYNQWHTKWKPYIIQTAEFKCMYIQDQDTIMMEYIMEKSWNKSELYDIWKHDFGL